MYDFSQMEAREKERAEIAALSKELREKESKREEYYHRLYETKNLLITDSIFSAGMLICGCMLFRVLTLWGLCGIGFTVLCVAFTIFSYCYRNYIGNKVGCLEDDIDALKEKIRNYGKETAKMNGQDETEDI